MAILVLVPPGTALADEQLSYWGEMHNAGHDTGYSENNGINKDDVHFEWSLGQFVVSGYTRVTQDADGNPIFLKNVGDEVTLSFRLNQNVDALNGRENLRISNDTKAHDQHFGISETNFGRGALITKFTDYQNLTHDSTLYTDFLAATEVGADTTALLCEEGDYEVALDYEIIDDGLLFFDGYSDYQIYFEFSVRNGNSMVFPFDVATGSELTNGSLTESGFFLDFAYSRYLTIDITKEVLVQGQSGDVLDVRWNRPAADGDLYTEEGVYTVTTSNMYTNERTTKMLYVGFDPLLRAYVITGLSLQQIKEQLAAGFTISESGELVSPDSTVAPDPLGSEQEEPDPVSSESRPPSTSRAESASVNPVPAVVVGVVALIAIVAIAIIVKSRKRRPIETHAKLMEADPPKLEEKSAKSSAIVECNKEDE
jgi:hypothetical protein